MYEYCEPLLTYLANEDRDRPWVELLEPEIDIIWKYCKDKDFMVELGTLVGGCSYIMSHTVKKILTIDLFEDLLVVIPDAHLNPFSPDNTFAKVSASLSKCVNVNIKKGITYDLNNLVDNDSVDVLFIDADHTYDGVKKDFDAWHTKVKLDSGVIIFHDYGTGWPGITKYVDELISDGVIQKVDSADSAFVTRRLR